ncbi:MAG: DUF624 domain-containing protein [Lachnospiraceae bacterium]|nr:DUF624 domain-containing protein [Lachnospiraceae bacterium]
MLRSFLFDPDSGLMLFFGRIVDFFWLSILTVIGCLPLITAGASISACLYCCRKMILHEDTHLTKKFWKAYRANMKKGILLEIIFLDIFLLLGGVVILMLYDEKIIGRRLNIPMVVNVIVLLLIIIYFMALVHVFPLNAFFENKLSGTLKNSFLIAVSNLPVTIAMLIVNGLPFLLCYCYPILWFFEAIFGIGLCAFWTAQLYRIVMKKLGIEET